MDKTLPCIWEALTLKVRLSCFGDHRLLLRLNSKRVHMSVSKIFSWSRKDIYFQSCRWPRSDGDGLCAERVKTNIHIDMHGGAIIFFIKWYADILEEFHEFFVLRIWYSTKSNEKLSFESAAGHVAASRVQEHLPLCFWTGKPYLMKLQLLCGNEGRSEVSLQLACTTGTFVPTCCRLCMRSCAPTHKSTHGQGVSCMLHDMVDEVFLVTIGRSGSFEGKPGEIWMMSNNSSVKGIRYFTVYSVDDLPRERMQTVASTF